MKKVIYVFLWFCLYLQGCEQKVEYQYDDVNRIYFQYEVLNSLGNKVSLDSVVFSFGKLSDDVGADTAKIVVRVLGNTSEEPRTYRVKVLEKGNYLNGETDMVADKIMYPWLRSNYSVPAVFRIPSGLLFSGKI